MTKIAFHWDWQPDKPSVIHCGQCGYQMTVQPRKCELCKGFTFYCLKCGVPFAIAARKQPDCGAIDRPQHQKQQEQPLTQKSVIDLPGEEGEFGNTWRDIWTDLFDFGLIDREFTVSEWVNILTNKQATPSFTSQVALRLKVHWKKLTHGKPPKKRHNKIVYSGQDLCDIAAHAIARRKEESDMVIEVLASYLKVPRDSE